MKRMTRNEFQEYMKANASRLWNEPGYTMADYNRDCDEVEIIPLDLSKYPLLSENSIKWINKLFTEEDTDRKGNYMLRGFTHHEYAELKALGCSVGDYGNGYSLWGYNSDECFIFTYCEGDTTLTLLPDRESYEREYKETLKWYKEAYA